MNDYSVILDLNTFAYLEVVKTEIPTEFIY